MQVVQGSIAQSSNDMALNDTIIEYMSGSGSDEESLSPIMDTVAPTNTRSTGTARMNSITSSNPGRTTVRHSINIILTSQLLDTSSQMQSRVSTASSLAIARSTSLTITRSLSVSTSTNSTTSHITHPTLSAPTNLVRFNGITSAGFGVGWIIGFVIGVLLTIVVMTSLYLCLRNKQAHTHPSPSKCHAPRANSTSYKF